jgi:putative transcriptional regulator
MRSPAYPDGKKIRLYAAVGTRVQCHRETAGLSQSDLAERIGVSKSTLGKVEDGQACPLHVLVALADVFDVTLDELVPVLTETRAA